MTDVPVFVDDLDIPGAWYGVTIRSPYAAGRLISVESPELPPDYVLIRGQNIPGKNQLNDLPVPILATENLSYIGEPVALLIGPDRAKLEALAALCEVQAEAVSPLLDPHDAPAEAVLVRRSVISGDVEKAFAEAKTVVDGTYHTGIQEHWYPEPNGALAEWVIDPTSTRGKIRVHTATQWPFQVKRSVAGALGIPVNTVIVEPSAIGVHLDGKIWYPALPACHAALGTFITKKPVKFMLSRHEDFRYNPKRNYAEVRIRSALGDGGRLLASEVTVLADLGAYGVFTNEILDQTCLGALAFYRQGAFKLEGSAIATNIPPAGPLAGFGMAQGFFAMERHVSRIADTLRENPVEWRKANLCSRKQPLAIGAVIPDQIFLEKILDTAAAMGDYHRKWASFETLREYRRRHGGPEKNEPLRGIGIATAYQTGGFLYTGNDKGVYTVELTLDKEGLEIRTGMVSSNTEYISIWQELAAEILSLEAEAVRVVSDNTDTAPDSGPAGLSRNITAVTRLVELACTAIRKQRFRDPLPITVRRSCRPDRVPGWSAEKNEASQIDQNAFAHSGWGAAAVEVEIDPVDYTPKIRGVWMGVDGGKILSQRQAWRSLRFGIIQALGWASREKLFYEEGLIPYTQIRQYDIAEVQDIPPIYIDFIWNDTAAPKGIGELPYNCIPAAFAQAVSQAMDHPFDRIPVTAGDIWDAENQKKNKEAV
ncbi:aldehyde oxidase [Spirochaetia bacterium]|nr:aldehyde oxidase [Spirochaetia bacterium]